MCHVVPQRMYFTWQCVMRYHNQCISPDNVLRGTTSSVFLLAMCYAVPQPVYFTLQCIIRYHDKCLSYDNVSYGTTTSASHLAMWHTVPCLVPCTWQCVIQYHDQCLSPGNVSYGTTTSATWQYAIWYHDQCNMTMRHTVTQPLYFTWQNAIRYHDQCLSPDNVSYGTTTSVFHMHKCWKFDSKFWRGILFQWLGKALWFSPETAFERRHWNLFSKENQKTKMAICTKRENVIDASRRHLYHVVSV